MRPSVAIAAAFLAALIPVAPASAQTSAKPALTYEPSPEWGPDAAFSTTEAQAGLEKVADCVVSKGTSRRQLTAFIRMIPGSAQYGRAALGIVDPECLPPQPGAPTMVRMRIRADTFRAAGLSALFRRDFGKTAPVDFADLSPLLLSQEFDGPLDQLPPGFRGRRAFGDCVVRAVPTAARDVLFTKPGSAEESAQFARIMPALKGCLTVDQTVALNKYELRGMLGEAIYQLELAYARAHPAPIPGSKG